MADIFAEVVTKNKLIPVAAQHNTAQHSTAQHSTAEHSTNTVASLLCFVKMLVRA